VHATVTMWGLGRVLLTGYLGFVPILSVKKERSRISTSLSVCLSQLPSPPVIACLFPLHSIDPFFGTTGSERFYHRLLMRSMICLFLGVTLSKYSPQMNLPLNPVPHGQAGGLGASTDDS